MTATTCAASSPSKKPIPPGRSLSTGAKARTQITDIGADVENLLRGLPGVVDVTGVKIEKPTHRIIHFRNLHTIPRESLAVDQAAVYGRELTEGEIDVLYEQHLLQVELIQVEQLAILRCLIHRHGLTTMHLEGLTENNAQEFARMAGALKAMEAEEIPPMREQLKEHQRRLRVNPRDRKAKMEVDSLVEILKEHRSQMLKMGAAGRLLIAGELKSVLALEDAAALKQANPVRDVEIKADAAKAAARNDAQVRELLKVPVSVIELSIIIGVSFGEETTVMSP